MSSAILYGAIVVIWAGVLIPRWLRRETPVATEVAEPETVAPPAQVPAAQAPGGAADEPGRGSRGGTRDGTRDGESGEPAPPGRQDAERQRVLRARRRLLSMLVVLAVASAALAVLKLAAWWVVLPPTVMLLGYLALLREASKADAERRRASASPGPRREPAARPAEPAHVPVPVAEVIDITARVSDDPFDQHTDAQRAVGGN